MGSETHWTFASNVMRGCCLINTYQESLPRSPSHPVLTGWWPQEQRLHGHAVEFETSKPPSSSSVCSQGRYCLWLVVVIAGEKMELSSWRSRPVLILGAVASSRSYSPTPLNLESLWVEQIFRVCFILFSIIVKSFSHSSCVPVNLDSWFQCLVSNELFTSN